jgi:hypothetical protein
MEKTMKSTFDQSWLLILSTCVVLFCSGAAIRVDGLDTTKIREVEKPKKSFGQVMAEVLGEIFKLPIRTVQVVNQPQWNGEAV